MPMLAPQSWAAAERPPLAGLQSQAGKDAPRPSGLGSASPRLAREGVMQDPALTPSPGTAGLAGVILLSRAGPARRQAQPLSPPHSFLLHK